MSRDISPDLRTVRLFLTQPHSCSYLADKSATTAFVDPSISISPKLYTELTHLGFRRSGKYFYSPRCKSCSACISARIPVNDFKPNRQQRRCLKQNQDLDIKVVTKISMEEHYPLYENYIIARHCDGDMFPPSRNQFDDFLVEGMDTTRYIEFRENGNLIACTVADTLNDGLSAIYTYYAPEADKRGLGTFAVLSLIHLCDRIELPYLYLGFWIKNAAKMSYKTRYKPLEMLVDGRWVRSLETA